MKPASSQRAHILYLYSASSYGGLVRNLTHIASHLDTSRFSATFLALAAEGDTGHEIRSVERAGISFETVIDTSKLDFRALARVAARLRTGEFDIVSAHGQKADVYAALLRYVYRIEIPLTSIAHGWVVPGVKMKFYDLLDKCSLTFFDKVVLVNSLQKSQLPLIPERKTTLIYNAIPLRRMPTAEERVDARSALEVAPDELAIGYCGRLSPEKRVDSLLKAFSRVEVPRATLLLAGEGAEKASLQALAKELGVFERVRFLGFVQDVSRVYAALDMYCSCSAKEGLPNSVLEAQLHGCAAVLSRIDGHLDIAGESNAVRLVETDNIEQIAEAISELLQSETLRIQMGGAARENVERRFGMDTRIAKLQGVYNELLEER